MKVISTKLEGCLIIEPRIFNDERGFFLETFQFLKYQDVGIDATFVQDNRSRSKKNVLRGLHFQIAKPQGKLVSVTSGAVYDVAVDLRPESKTFGEYFGVILSGENNLQLYIPAGFAHGFCTLTDTADFNYKCTEYYDPKSESGIKWNDPQLAIEWPVSDPIVSSKDQILPSFESILAEREV